MNWHHFKSAHVYQSIDGAFRIFHHIPEMGGTWELQTCGKGARALGQYKTLREAKQQAESHAQMAQVFGLRPVVIR